MNTSSHSRAILPQLIAITGGRVSLQVLAVTSGVLLLSILAQIAIPLPFTPVPITGQTFGVALVSLLWGRKLGLATVASYILLGSAGLPIFAAGKAGIPVGPTFGFLVGMFFAAAWMGTLADRGATKRFLTTWLAASSGSAIVFTFGLWGLSYFVPANELLAAGFLPFVPGDLIKTLLVSSMVYGSAVSLQKRNR